ncbi:class I SAM-dependent methyltransferase [Paenibacillus xylaniclasticus]|uniref:class I SAM-dependent methyltransferase n=1 Tax=Paenibacillus xylaniclasticus TaxID=588083 RepID=UPI000FD76DEA|nr:MULTISPECIES: class I SAM-dependent methyltransferase [Paenibacillus]GFN32795.1 hypothetical protein PCURB6_30550 [Paenibacillus curdlanolyticus]
MKDRTLAQIDLQYYKGTDRYSDGDVEDEILSIVQNNDDFTDILNKDDRWPILYHLSPRRRNLLEWYPFRAEGSVLEIGAGCGALTGLLCEKLSQVTVVELSKRRAEIIANRHRDFQHLKIMVGNLNDMDFGQSFDYVTLIGVLEYAGKFTDSQTPYLDFLRKIVEPLREGGTLLIAIENKYGLKYWNGCREDHTGRFFDGLEGYRNFPGEGVATFSKMELSELLEAAGLAVVDFYYPHPDYKLPVHIYSDEVVPSLGAIAREASNYDMDRLTLFNEEQVLNGLVTNGQFGFFANSFLVECKKREG